jgi:hypothetical protein
MISTAYPLMKFVAAIYPFPSFLTYNQPDVGFENAIAKYT